MKKLIMSLFVCGILISPTYPQVLTQRFSTGEARTAGVKVKKDVLSKAIDMPSFNVSELQKEDETMRGADVPYRFGYGFDVNYTLADGNWEKQEDGRLWSITFKSDGALSLTFIFENFSLPKGSYVNIVNSDESIVYGPVTSEKIPEDGFFLTDLIEDSIATIYLFEPNEHLGESSLQITKVVHRYCNFYAINDNYGYPNYSAPCNISVEAKFPEYKNEANAVALIILANGTSTCSGSLVLSTDMSFKPYILTAFHCINTELSPYHPYDPTDMTISSAEEANVNHWLIKFGYWQQSTYSVTFNGANYRAGWFDSDFALIELYEDVKQIPHITWLGWDRTGNTPSSGIGIHHPCGDYMKISIDEDPSLNDVYPSYSFPTHVTSHWLEHWEQGIAQRGSSGSPLLNENKRIVGQLHGPHFEGNHTQNTALYDPCSIDYVSYGKFSISWTGGGTNDTRLSNWLDPIGTNQTTINGSSPLSRMYISGPTVPEASSYYSVANLIDGYSVSWNYSGTAINSTISNGLFIINNQQKQYIKGILTANIFYHGSLVGTRTKTIHSGANFSGTYSQLGGQVIAPIGGTTYYDPIPTTPFSDNSGISVHRVLPVSITSPMFSSSTLSAQIGSLPTGWNQNGNTITYNFPRTGGPVIVPIIGRSNTGYDVFKFTIGVEPDFIDPGLPFLSSGNGMLTISLGEELDDGAGVRSTETDIDDLIWDVKIVNVMTGDIAYKGQVSGLSKTISTNGWPKGFYVVYIDFDGQSISRKISIN